MGDLGLVCRGPVRLYQFGVDMADLFVDRVGDLSRAQSQPAVFRIPRANPGVSLLENAIAHERPRKKMRLRASMALSNVDDERNANTT